MVLPIPGTMSPQTPTVDVTLLSTSPMHPAKSHQLPPSRRCSCRPCIQVWNSPYNDFKKNTNEIIMALLKPCIFVLATGAALFESYAGVFGGYMMMVQFGECFPPQVTLVLAFTPVLALALALALALPASTPSVTLGMMGANIAHQTEPIQKAVVTTVTMGGAFLLKCAGVVKAPKIAKIKAPINLVIPKIKVPKGMPPGVNGGAVTAVCDAIMSVTGEELQVKLKEAGEH